MLYLKLAWRNIWRNYRRTLISVTSILFAVVLSLFLVSLSEGSYDHMIDVTARFHTGYLQIRDPLYEDEPSLDNTFRFDEEFGARVETAHPDIESIAPRIETFMLAAGPEQTRGTMVLGIDLDREQQLNRLADRLEWGRFFEPDEDAAVLGEGLARRLNVAVGDTLVLLGQGRFGMTAAALFPITGLIRHPLPEVDNQIVYLPLPAAQWLLSAEGFVSHLLITPSGLREVPEVAEALRNVAGDGLTVYTWEELMPELLQGIQFDRIQQYLMMGILYVVIGFGLFGTILTMTLERLREFGLLLSIGMKRLQLSGVIFMETLMISLLGVMAGCLIGFPILLWFHHNPIRLGGDLQDIMLEMGFEPILPFALFPEMFLAQAAVIFLLSLLISIYPVLKVRSLNILEASRQAV